MFTFHENPQEIAERLRISINIAYQHYVVQNPLIQEAKAKIHRQKNKSKTADEESLELVARLETLSPSNQKLLNQFRDAVERRLKAKQEAKELGHTPVWINEAEVFSILKKSWYNIPRRRCLRKYFVSRKAAKRSGNHGIAYYDAVIARELSEKYEPVSDHIKKVSRAISLILSSFDSISIGWVKLIKRDQMGTFLKAVRGIDKELSPYKTGTTELTKLAKQEPSKPVLKPTIRSNGLIIKRNIKNWSGRPESNRRRSAWEVRILFMHCSRAKSKFFRIIPAKTPCCKSLTVR